MSHTAEGDGGSAAEMQAFDSERREWAQDVRALPCAAADALMWTGRMLHFGGRASARVPTPRMALAVSLSTRDRHANLGNHRN